jgi:inositol transport system permease protein
MATQQPFDTDTMAPITHARRRVPPEVNILSILVAVAVVFEILGWIVQGQSFLANPQRLTIMILQVSVIGIIAVGVTQVIITGGIDLSSGSVVATTAMIAMSFAQVGTYERAVYPGLTDLPVLVPIFVGLGVGLLAGLVNGSLIAYTGIPPFIATLGMMVTARRRQMVHQGPAGLLPVGGLRHHRLRRLAGGDLPRRRADLPHRAPLYPLRQVHLCDRRQCPGRAGLGHQCTAPPDQGLRHRRPAGGSRRPRHRRPRPDGAGRHGMMYELDAIAATVIGGTSLTGGVGRITGTVIGTVILGVMTSGFTFLRIDAYYQEIVKGMIIVAAVVADVYRQKKRVKKV